MTAAQENEKYESFVPAAVLFANTIMDSAARRFACGEKPNTTR